MYHGALQITINDARISSKGIYTNCTTLPPQIWQLAITVL